jgi:hypothetical protein
MNYATAVRTVCRYASRRGRGYGQRLPSKGSPARRKYRRARGRIVSELSRDHVRHLACSAGPYGRRFPLLFDHGTPL